MSMSKRFSKGTGVISNSSFRKRDNAIRMAVCAGMLIASIRFASANTELDLVTSGHTDLTAAATYSQGTAPSTSSDITFANSTYTQTTFNATSNLSRAITESRG
jgi:hypothetical protein